MCLPCSFAVDVIICLPMTGIYLFNKCNCKCKCDKKTKVKKVKVTMLDTDYNTKSNKDKNKDNNIVISTAPTALENPNLYQNLSNLSHIVPQ
jgi:hypothetical protein